MEKNQMMTLKQVEGEVEYNDGELAEIQTVGTDGIEKNLLLETIQMHRSNDTNTPRRVPSQVPGRDETEHLDGDRNRRKECE